MKLREYQRMGKLILTAVITGVFFIAGGAYAIPDEVKGSAGGITVSPTDIAITSDDRWMFVAGGSVVDVVDTATFEATSSVSGGSELRSVAVNSTDSYLYILRKNGELALVDLANLNGVGPGEAITLPSPSWNDVTDGNEPADMVVGPYPDDASRQLAFLTFPSLKEIWAIEQADILDDGNISKKIIPFDEVIRDIVYSNDPTTPDGSQKLLFTSMTTPAFVPAVSVCRINSNPQFINIDTIALADAVPGDSVRGISSSPDGQYMSVGNYTGGLLHILEADTSTGLAYNTMTDSPVTLSGTPHDVEYYKDKDGSEHFYAAVESASSILVDVISLSDITAPSTTINLNVAASSVSLATSTSTDGYVYTGPQKSGEVFVITSNPWIYDIEPSSSVNQGGITDVTFKTDEGIRYWVSKGGAIRKNSGTQIFSSDTVTTESAINTFTIDGAELTEGLNDIYIFVEDAEGNVGRRGFMLKKDLPPDAPNFRLGFGDSTIYVYVEALDVDDIDYYRIFYNVDSSAIQSDPPDPPYVDVYSFTKGEEFKHLIKGVQNGTRYYVRVRAVDSESNEGPLSEIKSITPQETESLVERGGESDSGGCATAHPEDKVNLAGLLALLGLWVAGIIAVRVKFGHKGGIE